MFELVDSDPQSAVIKVVGVGGGGGNAVSHMLRRNVEGVDFIDSQGSEKIREIFELATTAGAELRLARVNRRRPWKRPARRLPAGWRAAWATGPRTCLKWPRRTPATARASTTFAANSGGVRQRPVPAARTGAWAGSPRRRYFDDRSSVAIHVVARRRLGITLVV